MFSSAAKRSDAAFASASIAASLPASRWRWSSSCSAVSTTEVTIPGLQTTLPLRADRAVAGLGRDPADVERELGGAGERVAALVHRRRAGVRGLARPRDPVALDAERARARRRAGDPSTRARALARCAARGRRPRSRAARRESVARSRSTPYSRERVRRARSRSRRCSSRSSSWSRIEPAAALEPKSERPKRAPSSSAQLTRRTVSGGVPSSAIRRSTSTPATTFRQPSSQPPFGTESMCPPISSARSDSPGSVNHWFPASSISSSAPTSTFARSHSRARSQVSVHATRWAPFSSPVSSWSSRSSATVRDGSSGTGELYGVAACSATRSPRSHAVVRRRSTSSSVTAHSCVRA